MCHFHDPGYQIKQQNIFTSSMIMLLQDSQCQSDHFHDRRDLSFYAIPGNIYGGKYLIKPGTCCVSSQPHCK